MYPKTIYILDNEFQSYNQGNEKSKHLKAFMAECATANIRPFMMVADKAGSTAKPQVASGNGMTVQEAMIFVAQLEVIL